MTGTPSGTFMPEPEETPPAGQATGAPQPQTFQPQTFQPQTFEPQQPAPHEPQQAQPQPQHQQPEWPPTDQYQGGQGPTPTAAQDRFGIGAAATPPVSPPPYPAPPSQAGGAPSAYQQPGAAPYQQPGAAWTAPGQPGGIPSPEPAPAHVSPFGTPLPPGGHGASAYAPSSAPASGYNPDAGRRNGLAHWSYRLGVSSLVGSITAIVLYAVGLGGGVLVRLFVFVTAPVAIVLGHIAWAGLRRGMVDKPQQARIGTLAGYGALLLNTIAAFVAVLSFVGSINGLQDAENFADIPFTEPELLQTGDCVSPPVQSTVAAGITGEDEWAFQRVPCADDHWAEVYYAAPLVSSVYPGDGYDEVWALCEARFDTYVGIGYWDSEYYAEAYFPSRAEWDAGERWLLCILESLTPMTGTAGGTAR